MHGGGWVQGVRTAFQYWGPYLAARGIAVFAISYRLATKGKTFPQAVQDVLAGVQFVRGKAGEFGIDPARIGLLGASAGGHLAALAALSGKKFTGGYPQDAFAAVDHRGEGADRRLRRLRHGGDVDELSDPGRRAITISRNSSARRRWKTASFISMPRRSATRLSPTTRSAFFWSPAPRTIWSIRKAQTEPFQLALKQAGFFVRPCIVHGAPHYWMNDPIEEPGSYSGFLAPRLLRFLAEKL